MTDPRIKDLVIRIDDIRNAGHCVRGAKAWFERHGLDFRAFIKDGISAQEFIDKGDALAARVVKKKLERDGG